MSVKPPHWVYIIETQLLYSGKQTEVSDTCQSSSFCVIADSCSSHAHSYTLRAKHIKFGVISNTSRFMQTKDQQVTNTVMRNGRRVKNTLLPESQQVQRILH